jgi:hypothetical protein
MNDPSAVTVDHPLLPNRHNPAKGVTGGDPDRATLMNCQVVYLYAAAEILVTLHPRSSSQPQTFRIDANTSAGESTAMFSLLTAAMLSGRRVDVAYLKRADGETQNLVAVALDP